MTGMWITGRTGSGKSTVAANIAVQAMQRGLGLIVIDPTGELCATLVNRLPDHRVGDLINVNPADFERPVGVNLLAGTNPQLAADSVVTIFRRMFTSYGPRMDDVLRSSLLTLAANPEGSTLAELPMLLVNSAFRRKLLTYIADDVPLAQFWQWFEGLSVAEAGAVVAPLTSRLRAIMLRRPLLNTIGQLKPVFTFEQVLQEQKIVLVSLDRGQLGEDASALMGGATLALVWKAVLARSAVPATERKSVLVMLDEMQTFLSIPTPLAGVLAESRKYGVAWCLANQAASQLDRDTRSALLTNAATKIHLGTSVDDARILARELSPYLAADDLRALPPFEAVLQIAVGGAVTRPATGRTLPLTPPTGRGEAARAFSRERYGRDRAEVEAEIRARQQSAPVIDGPVGRRRSS